MVEEKIRNSQNEFHNKYTCNEEVNNEKRMFYTAIYIYIELKVQNVYLKVLIPLRRGVLDTALYDKVCQ